MKKLIIIVLALLLYVTMSELSAKQKAESLCSSVNIGDSANNLLEKAINAGARKSGTYLDENRSPKTLYAAFTGYYPGSDFICGIDIANGVVVAKHPSLITSLLQ